MTAEYPRPTTALQIWSGGVEKYLKQPHVTTQAVKEYIFHTSGIGRCCRLIAERTGSMDSDKAFALGLLHDYGKYADESHGGDFHCRVGYNDLTAMGYPASARICLTHFFPEPSFRDADYKFSQEWKDWARKLLKPLVYDEYDRLVQLIDLLFEGMNITTLRRRHQGIVNRYGLEWADIQISYENALRNKNYFDEKCGRNIYELLEINDD